MNAHRLLIALASVLLIAVSPVFAEEDGKAILEKAAKAIGADKLSEAKAFSWKTKGKLSFGGMESEFGSETIVQGVDHMRSKFEGDFGGNKVEGVTVLDGDKGWRSFGGMKMPLDGDGLAVEKRNAYLQIAPALITPLQGKGFEIKGAGESDVDGKAALRVKFADTDGKDFTIYFDKETGLPIKQTADVQGFMGEEYKQETFFKDYKDFDGIKKATKIEVRRDGETLLTQEVTEFKALKEVPADTFAEPK